MTAFFTEKSSVSTQDLLSMVQFTWSPPLLDSGCAAAKIS
jgi:hypothetical protein